MVEGPHWARIYNIQRRCNTGGCRCSSARRQRRRGRSAKQGRDEHCRTGVRGGVHLLCRTPLKRSRLSDGRQCSQSFCGASAALDEYVKIRIETGASGKEKILAGSTALGSGDGGRKMSDESPPGKIKAVSYYTWLVCAVKIRELKRNPHKAASSVRSTTPSKLVRLVRGTRPSRQCFPCEARAHPKQCFWCGARAHPKRSLGSARREGAARRSKGGRHRYFQQGWGLSTARG